MTGSPLVVNDAFLYCPAHDSLLGTVAIRSTTLSPKAVCAHVGACSVQYACTNAHISDQPLLLLK